MRFQILSDIHLEFHKDEGRSFLSSLNGEGVDALIIAGDFLPICNILTPLWMDIIAQLVDKYEEVLLVTGNHCYYNSSREYVHIVLKFTESLYPNFHFLDKKTVSIKGVDVSGATLWFPNDPLNIMYEKQIADFKYIARLREWVYEEHEAAITFFKESNAPIWVTHHLPSQKCVVDRYKGSLINRFFVGDMEEIILDNQPKYHIFGHTHDSVNIQIGGTRVISNPRGYYPSVNPCYKDQYVIEV